MNEKRWIAVVLAVMLMVVSFGMSKITKSFILEDKEENIKDDLKKVFKKSMTQDIYREGDIFKQIMVIDLIGQIGGNTTGSFGGGYNQQEILSQLNMAMESDEIRGVIIYMDTPGGAVHESSEIYHKVKEVRESGIPVYVSMQSMGASGGYYIACGADKIYASPETVTGSIGVIMSSMNFSELLEKHGIKDNVIKSGKMKDVPSIKREMTEEEREYLQNFVDSAFERFLDVVEEGRPELSRKEIEKLADGRIYDGQQAKANGLIDELGFFDDAIDGMMKDYELEGAMVVKYKPDVFGLPKAFSFIKDGLFNGVLPIDQMNGFRNYQPLYIIGG